MKLFEVNNLTRYRNITKKVLIGFKRTNLGSFTYIDKTILFQSIFEHLIKRIDGMFHFS